MAAERYQFGGRPFHTPPFLPPTGEENLLHRRSAPAITFGRAVGSLASPAGHHCRHAPWTSAVIIPPVRQESCKNQILRWQVTVRQTRESGACTGRRLARRRSR